MLYHDTQNQKVPGSNPTERSAGFWDPSSLPGFQQPAGLIRADKNNEHRVSEAVPFKLA